MRGLRAGERDGLPRMNLASGRKAGPERADRSVETEDPGTQNLHGLYVTDEGKVRA